MNASRHVCGHVCMHAYLLSVQRMFMCTHESVHVCSVLRVTQLKCHLYVLVPVHRHMYAILLFILSQY